MLNLWDLPAELLDWTFSYVEDTADLLNLSLSCKFLNKYVEPFLYRSYTNLWLDYRRSLAPFIRRLIANPGLARHTKKVELGRWNTKRGYLRPDYGCVPTELLDPDFDLFVDAAKRAGLIGADQDSTNLRPIVKSIANWMHYGEEYDTDGLDSENETLYSIHPDEFNGGDFDDVQFLRCLQFGIEDPQVILLLSQLPCLEELCLKGVPEGLRLSWEKLCSPESASFSALKSVKASGTEGEARWDLRHLVHLLAIPSLQELKAYLATTEELEVGWYFDYKPKTLSLTKIHFECCVIDTQAMASLIEGCRSLESFTFTVAGGDYVEDDYPVPQFTAPQLRKALLSQKSTLRQLTLDFSDWCYAYDYGTFGSLVEFEVLERLAIDYGTLRWHPNVETDDEDEESDIHQANTEPPLPELLPKSLQDLTIAFAPAAVVENLLAFSRYPRDDFPHLKSVRVAMYSLSFTRRTVPGYSMMVSSLEDLGIKYMEKPQCGTMPLPTMKTWIAKPTIHILWDGTRYKSRKTRSHLQAMLDRAPKCPHLSTFGLENDCFDQDWEAEGWSHYDESIPDESEDEYFWDLEYLPHMPFDFDYDTLSDESVYEESLGGEEIPPTVEHEDDSSTIHSGSAGRSPKHDTDGHGEIVDDTSANDADNESE